MATNWRVAAVLLGVWLGALQLTHAQQAGNKREFELRGKVEQVDTKAGKVTVDHEDVEGWMKAMKMIYKVDKAEVLKTLKRGDQITATVYEGDFDTLYSVRRAVDEKGKKPRQ